MPARRTRPRSSIVDYRNCHSTFDPAALENILSGQEGSTPIFNQLFGAIDYAEDEEDIEDQDMEELEAQMDFESGPLRKRRRRKQVSMDVLDALACSRSVSRSTAQHVQGGQGAD